MFGMNMKVKHKGQVVILRRFCKDDLPEVVEHFGSMKVHMYTMGTFAQTIENEIEWYDKNRNDPDSCLWGIQPEGSEKLIGVVGLHGLRSMTNTCVLGIIIWDEKWWNRGIATAAHLAVLLYAAKYKINRMTIRCTVRVDNVPSWRIVEKLGYYNWGEEPVDDFVDGKWINSYQFTWFSPIYISVLFPAGVPEKYFESVERGRLALELATKEVEFF